MIYVKFSVPFETMYSRDGRALHSVIAPQLRDSGNRQLIDRSAGVSEAGLGSLKYRVSLSPHGSSDFQLEVFDRAAYFSIASNSQALDVPLSLEQNQALGRALSQYCLMKLESNGEGTKGTDSTLLDDACEGSSTMSYRHRQRHAATFSSGNVQAHKAVGILGKRKVASKEQASSCSLLDLEGKGKGKGKGKGVSKGKGGETLVVKQAGLNTLAFKSSAELNEAKFKNVIGERVSASNNLEDSSACFERATSSSITTASTISTTSSPVKGSFTTSAAFTTSKDDASFAVMPSLPKPSIVEFVKNIDLLKSKAITHFTYPSFLEFDSFAFRKALIELINKNITSFDQFAFALKPNQSLQDYFGTQLCYLTDRFNQSTKGRCEEGEIASHFWIFERCSLSDSELSMVRSEYSYAQYIDKHSVIVSAVIERLSNIFEAKANDSIFLYYDPETMLSETKEDFKVATEVPFRYQSPNFYLPKGQTGKQFVSDSLVYFFHAYENAALSVHVIEKCILTDSEVTFCQAMALQYKEHCSVIKRELLRYASFITIQKN